MTLIQNINVEYEKYRKGLLTYGEMLDSIITLVENEKSYRIEYKAIKGKWKTFTDTEYLLPEAKEEVERLNGNEIGLKFRYIAI